jgi:aminomethyltransferase
MRTSPLHDFFAQAGARFTERHGVECVDGVSTPAREYALVRDAVALSDDSYMQVFRIPEAGAVDVLDPLLAGNVARTRFGRLLHTFLADDEGHLAADCYVANNDDEFLLICESITDDAAVRSLFMDAGSEAGIEDLTGSHAMLGLDGYKAWAVAKEVFGADILGLPYLSVEKCAFDGEPVRLFRAGKTSEFGYLILVPCAKAEALAATLAASAAKQGGGLCGSAIHGDLRLEGRFFNIFAEGRAVRDPLSLGLQWMIDFDKPAFRGGEAIRRRRAAGLSRKIVGVRAAPGQALDAGMPLFEGGEEAGRVVAACTSHVLGCRMGLALLPSAVAFAGVRFAAGQAAGPAISVISMPPIMPKSLTVKLDEM